MARFDLDSDEGVKAAAEAVLTSNSDDTTYREWTSAIAREFEWVASTSRKDRESREFHSRLWDHNPVTTVGMGTVSITDAIENEDFRNWFAAESVSSLPDAPSERSKRLSALYDELAVRFKRLCDRVPHIKIFRGLAVLYPGEFTTIGHRRALRRLYFAMGGPRGADVVERHRFVLDRLERVLGKVEGYQAQAERIALPWLLYAGAMDRGEVEPTEQPTSTPGEEKLIPLPATRRRRGLTAFRGGFASVLAVLDFVRDGVTRDQLIDYLRASNPTLKDSSLGVLTNILQGELAVIRMDGDRYVLTERGEAVLEEEDPGELSDWLLTHILGVDNALAYLRDHGATDTHSLIRVIQSANPGWTTEFKPRGVLGWLRSFGVLATEDGITSLTDTGKGWADRIHWDPQVLPSEDDELLDDVIPDEVEAPAELGTVSLPSLAAIYASIAEGGRFQKDVVAQLHAGLWGHRRRHFAILTGLSGAGKTLLARRYGMAILPEGSSPSRHLCTIAVQPSWYDPGALLGYVNPLRGDSYIRTPFLEFLLAASEDPARPYIAVLDEMNLSHPEQYLAPLLSAMETGARISFHSEGELFDGVPASITYPSNLVLIGTVNMDETTHGLSDKVLDRAYTIEFWEIDLDHYPRWNQRGLPDAIESRAREALKDLMGALAPARLHFGWRIVDDVLDFLAIAATEGSEFPIDDALDRVIHSKIVPKLRGDDSPRFRDALVKCAAVLKDRGLEHSRLKVEELQRDLEATGSARFWR